MPQLFDPPEAYLTPWEQQKRIGINDAAYQAALNRRLAVNKNLADTLESRRESDLRRRHEAAMRSQEIAAQAARIQQQHMNDMQAAAQRAGFNADAAAMDNAYATQMQRQQAKDLAARDKARFGYDTQMLNKQQQWNVDRDKIQFDQQMQRDAQQQQYTQQNMWQREAADVSARWNDQVQQAKQAGMDFSERQKKEMADLDANFRKNVLNGPYDEATKQQALLEHQKKLASIIPEERVVTPNDALNSSLIFHEPTNTWYMHSRDKGGDRFEPLQENSPAGQNQNAAAQAEEKKAERTRTALFEREEKFSKLKEKLAVAEDSNGNLLYGSPEEIAKAAMDQFAPMEAHYRSQYGLPPQADYQKEADIEKQKVADEAKKQQERQGKSQYDIPPAELQKRMSQHIQQQRDQWRQQQTQNYEADPPPAEPAKIKPQSVSASNIDDLSNKAKESNDQMVFEALQIIKHVSGMKPEDLKPGSPEMNALVEAQRYLRSRGISTKAEPAKPKPQAPQPIFGPIRTF